MSEVNQSDFNVFKAKAISRGKLLDKIHSRIVEITDHIQNEGDRAYFGSTNHADELVALFHELDGLRWDRMLAERPERDPYADCRELRVSLAAKDAKIAQLLDALKAAKEVVDVAEGMASCKSDDEFIWSRQVIINAAIAKATGGAS